MHKTDIRLMAFVASAMFWGSGYAADNSIYIDQSGDNSTITMTQDGSGNKVKGILANGTAGGTTDPAKLTGNAQTINVEQIGQGNSLALGANTTQGGSVSGYANVGVHLNYQATGNLNTALININNNGTGTAAGNVVDIQQSGNTNTTTLRMTGTSNQFTVNTTGGNSNTITADVNASNTVTTINHSGGGGNNTTVDMTGNSGQVSVTTVGASNTTSVTQSAYSSLGSQTLIDITGSGNTTNVTQSGVADHYTNIKLYSGSNDNNITVSQSGTYNHSADITLRAGSSTNTIGITQSGGGASGGQTAVLELLAGSSNNNVSITQQGSVSNLSNIRLSGNSNNYTILQKN